MSSSPGKRGFTLIEVLVVIGIIAVIAAIAFPVYARAKRESRKTECVSNLKQIYAAIAIYRSDYGCDGVYGTSKQMGLPDLKTMSEVTPDLRCAMPHPVECTGQNGYSLKWPAGPMVTPEHEEGWSIYVNKYQEDSILMTDAGHSQSCPITPLSTNTAMALTLGGSVIHRTRVGNPDFVQFFHEP